MLRDYQQDSIRDLYASMREHNRVVLQSPTGSGKTHVAMSIIQQGLRHGKRINFYVDRLTLIDQTIDRFLEDGINVGVMQANHPMSRPHAPVQVISMQTISRRHEAQWPKADLHIVDECHDQHTIIHKIMDRWPEAKYVGLSATPFTRGLGRHWDDLVVAVTTDDLIKQGHLCPYIAFGPSTPDMKGVRISAGDYNANDLEERMNVLTGGIVTHWKQLAGNKKTLCFTPNVAYAIHLAEEFQRQGIEADYVCGRDSDERRADVMGRYADGKIKILMNCEVLTKGYDQPDIECVILAKPTRSLSQHIQMVGRGLRTSPGKENVLFLDHAGNFARNGLPDDPLPTTLDMGKKGERSDCRDPKEPEPWTCNSCYTVVPPRTRQCPSCGTIPKTLPDVEVKDEKLTLITKGGTKSDKQEVHAMLRCIQQANGYKDGWTARQYRVIFGVWPRGLNADMILAPSKELDAHLKEERRKFNATLAIKAKYTGARP